MQWNHSSPTKFDPGGKETRWILDSGASHHFTSSQATFAHAIIRSSRHRIKAAIGQETEATVTGDVLAEIGTRSGSKTVLPLNDVLFAPALDKGLNLLSTTRLAQDGWTTVTSAPSAIIVGPQGQVVVSEVDSVSSSHYLLLNPIQKPSAVVNHLQGNADRARVNHWRMGHLGLGSLKKLSTSPGTKGLKDLKPEDVDALLELKEVCDVCAIANQKTSPFPKTAFQTADQALQRVLIDIMGPFDGHPSYYYSLTLVDEWSRKNWHYVLADRRATTIVNALHTWSQMVETESGQKVTHIHTDNGLEFAAETTQTWAQSKGVYWTWTAPYSSAQNGIAERHNGMIQERGRAMLAHARLPTYFWPFAFEYAAYLLNRSPSSSIGDRLPQEVWTGKPVDLSLIRIFGCLAFAHVSSQQRRGKLAARSVRGFFLGLSDNRKAWMICCPSTPTNYMRWCRSVVFDETRQYDQNQVADGIQQLQPLGSDEVEVEVELKPDDGEEPQSWRHSEAIITGLPTQETLPMPQDPAPEEVGEPSSLATPPEQHSQDEDGITVQDELVLQDRAFGPEGPPEDPSEEIAPPTGWRRSPGLNPNRDKEQVSVALSVCLAVLEAAAISSNVDRPVSKTEPVEPKSWTEVTSLEDGEKNAWLAAMKDEISQLQKMQTWEMVDRPTNASVVGSKWVFRIKTNANGEMTKRKGRLVAQGFRQTNGINYEETFSPVARLVSIRIIISYSHRHGWILHAMDVKSAYLNGDLDIEILMEQPPGFHDGTKRVCRLRKALYGLKQAGRAWYLTLKKKLLGHGYEQLGTDTCIFVLRDTSTNDIIAILTLYVDDLVIAGKDTRAVQQVKDDMNTWFEMTDNGPLSFILGIRVEQRHKGLVRLDQTAYIDKIVKGFGSNSRRKVENPVKHDGPPSKHEGTLLKTDEIRSFAALVGSLLWVSQGTRPDIAFIVSHLSRFMACPTDRHWEAGLRVVQYLNQTRRHALTFRSAQNTILQGYSDADFASDPDTRRSVSAYVFEHHGNVIAWRSKLQDTISASSAEAEYLALSAATREALFLIHLLNELDISLPRAVDIFTDSSSAKAISDNPTKHSRTKHIQVHHHLVREWQAKKVICVCWIEGQNNLADYLTKSKSGPVISKMNERLGLHPRSMIPDSE